MPNDPIMLLSFVNTQLRDNYDDIEDFSAGYGVKCEDIIDKLADVGYHYSREDNRFI